MSPQRFLSCHRCGSRSFARPARGMDDRNRQVSWLTDQCCCPPSQAGMCRALSGMMDSGSPLTVAGAASELPRRTRCAKHPLSATAPNSLLRQLAPAPVPCPQSSGAAVPCQRHNVRESPRDGLPRTALQMGDSGPSRAASCWAACRRRFGGQRLRIPQRRQRWPCLYRRSWRNRSAVS